jgi:hypothetical protein
MIENINSILEHFTLAKFTVVYQAGKEGVILPPFKGSVFRGAFGHVFKEMFCFCPNQNHKNSEHMSDCIYGYIFETKPSEDSAVLKKYESVPRPFIIEPPLDEKQYYYPGERITLDFLLFGKAVKYFPYFISTLKKMGEIGIGRGKHTLFLKQVFLQDLQGYLTKCVYDDHDGIVKQIQPVSVGSIVNRTIKNQEISKCKVYFITPTRMKWEGSYILEPEFHIVLRNTVRRITSLLYFHHDTLLDIDFRSMYEEASKIKLIQQKVEWKDWERYSNRQQERIKLGGIVGEATYLGELTPYLPWLYLGEMVHIGKNAVFGLGKIFVNEEI